MGKSRDLELLPGETYALGFRRLSKEVARLHYLERHARWTGRLRTKVKRMQPVIQAARDYYRARENVSSTQAAVNAREVMWARLRFSILTHDRAERAAETMRKRHQRNT